MYASIDRTLQVMLSSFRNDVESLKVAVTHQNKLATIHKLITANNLSASSEEGVVPFKTVDPISMDFKEMSNISYASHDKCAFLSTHFELYKTMYTFGGPGTVQKVLNESVEHKEMIQQKFSLLCAVAAHLSHHYKDLISFQKFEKFPQPIQKSLQMNIIDFLLKRLSFVHSLSLAKSTAAEVKDTIDAVPATTAAAQTCKQILAVYFQQAKFEGKISNYSFTIDRAILNAVDVHRLLFYVSVCVSFFRGSEFHSSIVAG